MTEDSIVWTEPGESQFELFKDELLTLKTSVMGTPLYEYILLATDQEWLSENDLYDFNYAFVYAAAKFKLDFSYEIFDETLAEQFEQFEKEDDDDSEWP